VNCFTQFAPIVKLLDTLLVFKTCFCHDVFKRAVSDNTSKLMFQLMICQHISLVMKFL